MPLHPLLRRFARKIRRLFVSPPEDPEDPYALVGARIKPKPPTFSAKAAAVPERYDFN
jgi:hypothetical protein